MSKTFLIILYSLMVTNFVAMARRGDSDKGGGGTPENFPTAGAAWFLGNHLISYCLEVAPDFGKTKEELAPLIPKAFATWQSYIEKHEVYYDKYLKTEQRFISTRLLPLSDPKSNIFKCYGTEDITFYFGVENERVKKGREMSPELKTVPFFFIRESYNPRTKLGSGFVFFEKQDPNDTHDNGTYPNRTHLVDGDAIIRPSYYSDLMFVPSNWRIPNSIYAALLHEVGHILGCSHLEGTIMSSDIGIWMHHNVLTKAEQKLQFTNIDHQNELVSPFNEYMYYYEPLYERSNKPKKEFSSIEGVIALPFFMHKFEERFDVLAFNLLMNRLPDLDEPARSQPLSATVSRGPGPQLTLSLQDKSGRANFVIVLDPRSELDDKPLADMFKIAFACSDGEIVCSHKFIKRDITYLSSLYSLDGKKEIPVIVHLGSLLGNVRLELQSGGRIYPLFSSPGLQSLDKPARWSWNPSSAPLPDDPKP